MSFLFWLPNLGMGASSGATTVQVFEEAFRARLLDISEITDIVGGSIFIGALPQVHDLGAQGPALTYSVPTKPRGHTLAGSDGTATARVQLDAWSYSQATVKDLIEAIDNGIGGPPISTPWGNGTCVIVSVVHQNEIDADEAPEAGNDLPIYHTIAEYNVRYRVSIPTLS